jgi:hypothetical protein
VILYPRWFPVAGFTPLPWLTIIRADCRDNVALHKHEEVHQRQMHEDGWLLFVVFYLFSRKCRQNYEVEAYKTSIAHGVPLSVCAVHLSSMYYLGITVEQAEELLK